MSEILVVSPEAVAKVVALRNAEEAGSELALRLGVRSGGCSGFSYEMFFDTERASDDVVLRFDAEPVPLEVVIDAASLELLRGASLEFKDGLGGSGFKITNPNATRTCGCSKSFGA